MHVYTLTTWGSGGGHAPPGNLDPLRLLLVECKQFPTKVIIKLEFLVLVW